MMLVLFLEDRDASRLFFGGVCLVIISGSKFVDRPLDCHRSSILTGRSCTPWCQRALSETQTTYH